MELSFKRRVDLALQTATGGFGLFDLCGMDWPEADFAEADDVEGAVEWICEAVGIDV